MLSTKEKKLKAQVYDLLGRKCICCGFTHAYALQIDHINNNGKEDRKAYSSHPALYEHILEVGGEGYQILCANCNIIKYRYNIARIDGTGWSEFLKSHGRRRKLAYVKPTTWLYPFIYMPVRVGEVAWRARLCMLDRVPPQNL